MATAEPSGGAVAGKNSWKKAIYGAAAAVFIWCCANADGRLRMSRQPASH